MFCLRILKTALSRIAAAGLITILSASLATAQTPKTTPFIHDLKDEHLLTNLFKESGFGYSIRYPQDWTYTKPTQYTVIFSGKEGTEGYYSTVTIQNLASTAIGGKYINLDSVVDDLKSQLKKGAQNVTIYDEQPFIYVKEWLKLEGREFKAEYLRQGEKFRQWVIAIPRKNKEIFHAWFYTSPVNQYEKYLNVARFVLSSWAIEDKPESTLEKPLHPVTGKEEDKKFVHPKLGFSLVIPQQWKEKEKKTADGEIELEAVEGLAEFIVNVYEPGNPDLMANIHHFEKENVGEGKLFQTKHRGHELIVDGEKAYAGIYEDRDGYIARIIFVRKSARLYVLWGISRARELSMWEPMFDRIVASFRVTEPSIPAEKPIPTETEKQKVGESQTVQPPTRGTLPLEKETDPYTGHLANVLYRHAIDQAQIAEKKQDRDAYELAILYAEWATELYPRNADFWLLLGRLYGNMLDNPNAQLMAEDALDRAIEIDPSNKSARILLGYLLFYQERYAPALDQFEDVVRRNPDILSPSLVGIMNASYILDTQFSRGADFFRNVLQSRPNADSARLALAILLKQQKKRAAAEMELQKIIKRTDASEENRRYALKLIEYWNIEETVR